MLLNNNYTQLVIFVPRYHAVQVQSIIIISRSVQWQSFISLPRLEFCFLSANNKIR